jgi:O-antigen/teichoic acid export membrane protein
LHRVLLSEVADSVVRPLLLLAFFLLLGSVFSVSSTFAVLWGNVLAVTVVAVVLARHLWRHLPRPAVAAVPDMAERADWLATALPMIFIAGMSLIMSRTDIIMLGSLAGPAEAGIYAIGSRVAELATLGLVAVNTVLAPRISEMYRGDDRRPLQALLRLAAWFSFAFTSCAALALVGLGPFVLPLFGEDFAAAYLPMLILLAGQVVSALVGSVGFLMTMTGRQKEAATVMFVAVLINVVGNWLLIPLYGMMGAAIATGLSIAFWNVVLCVRVVRNVRLNPSVLPMRLS